MGPRRFLVAVWATGLTTKRVASMTLMQPDRGGMFRTVAARRMYPRERQQLQAQAGHDLVLFPVLDFGGENAQRERGLVDYRSQQFYRQQR